jgi:hypothetical protein
MGARRFLGNLVDSQPSTGNRDDYGMALFRLIMHGIGVGDSIGRIVTTGTGLHWSLSGVDEHVSHFATSLERTLIWGKMRSKEPYLFSPRGLRSGTAALGPDLHCRS